MLMLAPQPVVHRYAGLKLKSAGGIFLSCNELPANLCVFLRLFSWKRTTIRRGAGTIFQILRRSSTGSSAKRSNVTSGALLSSVGASKVLECSERQEISGFSIKRLEGLRMRILKRHNGTLSQRMVRDITYRLESCSAQRHCHTTVSKLPHEHKSVNLQCLCQGQEVEAGADRRCSAF